MRKAVLFILLILFLACGNKKKTRCTLEKKAMTLVYLLNYQLEGVYKPCENDQSIVNFCLKSYGSQSVDGRIDFNFECVDCKTGSYARPCIYLFTGVGFDIESGEELTKIKHHKIYFPFHDDRLKPFDVDTILKGKVNTPNFLKKLIRDCIK